MDKTSDITITSPTDIVRHDISNKDNTKNDENILIFENGTISGTISGDSLIINNNLIENNLNASNNSINNLIKSRDNVTMDSSSTILSSITSIEVPISKQNEDSSASVTEEKLCNTTSTNITPNTNINCNNIVEINDNQDNNNCNTNITDFNNSNITEFSTLLTDQNNYELNKKNINSSDNNSNQSVTNIINSNSFITNNNNNNHNNSINQIDLLNSSICSFESHISLNGNNKRIVEQSNITMTATNTNGLTITTTTNGIAATTGVSNQIKSSLTSKIIKSNTNHNFYDNRYHPPQYTAIYFDSIGNTIGGNTNHNTNGIIAGGGGGSGMGIGVGNIVSNNNGNITNYFHGRSYDNLNQIHHQQYNSSDLANNIGIVNDVGNDSNQYGGTNNVGTNRIDSNRTVGTVGIIQRRRGGGIGCFRQWFTRPSLPFIIGILALGGVACTLGGIILGSTGLVEHSTQYLSAALLMIGIGVSLLVISGAIWRLSIPDEVENCPCFRHLETCRNCNSPYCGNRLLTTYNGYMYPEFQHRPPPPSYMTSLNECTVGLLFHHEVANLQRNDSIRISTPPPAYRSSQSLSVFVPLHATLSPSQHSLIPELTIPLSTTTILSESQTDAINTDVITNSQILPKVMSTVHENSSPTSKKDGVTQLSEMTIE